MNKKSSDDSVSDDFTLCKDYCKGQESLTTLIERHKGFCWRYATNFHKKNARCEIEDFYQLCRLALTKAATRFDPSKGCTKFLSYAGHWMFKLCQEHAEKVKDFGSSDQLTEDGFTSKESFSGYLSNTGSLAGSAVIFAGRMPEIYALYRKKRITQGQLKTMAVILSPPDEQAELQQELFMAWWQRCKMKTLRAVARAKRGNGRRKAGKI
jgi:hypothetical protein